jgi:hypothetical protein
MVSQSPRWDGNKVAVRDFSGAGYQYEGGFVVAEGLNQRKVFAWY